MSKAKKQKSNDNTIAINKKARHDFFLSDDIEAGIELRGWEVKSLRQKKIQLLDSHVIIKDGEAFLLGAHITPLPTVSSHTIADPTRTRKLLLHQHELAKFFSSTQQKGYTIVCTKMYWKGHLVKCRIALAKGKQKFDKRATEKEREVNLDRRRAMMNTVR